MGDGFGIPLVVRYLLETCGSVADARATLARLPYSLAHNLTVVDGDGDVLTAYLSPDREPIFRSFPAATNHQGIVEWPEQAKATRTIERERCIVERLDDEADTVEGFADAFLRAPLFSTAYASGWGTLYTAVYRPVEGVVDYRWPTSHVATRLRGVRGRPNTSRCSPKTSPPARQAERRGSHATPRRSSSTRMIDRVIDITERVQRFAAAGERRVAQRLRAARHRRRRGDRNRLGFRRRSRGCARTPPSRGTIATDTATGAPDTAATT